MAHEKSTAHAHPTAAAADAAPVAPTAQTVEEPPPPPVVSALLPAWAAVGDPSFILRVLGSGFDRTSIIVFAGQEEPTTYFSAHELTTGVNMPLWQGPDPAIPVLVRTGVLESAPVAFAMLPPRAVPLDPADASRPSPAVDQI